jgi:hypothetical protein
MGRANIDYTTHAHFVTSLEEHHSIGERKLEHNIVSSLVDNGDYGIG